jgi:hypothetical protein
MWRLAEVISLGLPLGGLSSPSVAGAPRSLDRQQEQKNLFGVESEPGVMTAGAFGSKFQSAYRTISSVLIAFGWRRPVQINS